MKGGSFNKLLKNIMYSKIVLYILLALATLNLIKYLLQNNLVAIVIFLLIGFIVTCFTKNMTYVLLSAIVVTNLITTSDILNKFNILEGLENEKHKKHKKHKKHGDNGDGDDETGNGSEDDGDSDDDSHSNPKNKNNSKSTNDDIAIFEIEEPSSSTTKSSAHKNTKDKVSFKNIDDDEDEEDKAASVDYNNTVQDAFNNLEDILGSGGMEQMTKNTEQLAQRQENLISAMNKMGPLMGMAQKMLTQLNSGAMGKLFGG